MKTIRDILPPDQAAHLLAYKEEVEKALPGQVERVVLFGSRARGDAHEDSDFDVAVFVTGDRMATISVLSGAAYEHVLQGVFIRPVPMNGGAGSELAQNIEREGVLVQ